jgi:integrase
LAEAIERFSEKHFKKLRRSSADRYAISIGHLIDYMSSVRLDEIGSAMLAEFAEARLEEASAPTVRRDLACLSSIFSRAEEWEWVTYNPVKPFLRGHGLKESEPRTRWLTHEEEDDIIPAAPRKAARAIIFAIDTGLRRNEQFSLLRTEVNLRAQLITVRAEIAKSGKRRQVPVLPRTLAMLKEMFAASVSPYVFSTEKGEPYSKSSPTMFEALQKASRRAGIKEHVQWHDLRRTCGCRLLQDYRMSIEQVSNWLGHSDVRVTQERYAFLKVEHLQQAVRGTIKGT